MHVRNLLISCLLVVSIPILGGPVLYHFQSPKQPATVQPSVTSVPSPTPSPEPVVVTPVQAQEPIIGKPSRIIIPSINLDTEIEHLGNDYRGHMDIPQDDAHTGWYEYGVNPGEVGNAVIDGRYDSKTGPAVFHNLKNITVGDKIQVRDDKNNLLTFEVTAKEIYPDDPFPIQKVFGPADTKNLNLITCTGVFDPKIGDYRSRLVVFTKYLSMNS